MPPSGPIEIQHGLAIPEAELSFRTSRASGPGGQHVNKASTRVELLFDIEASPSLDGWHKQRLRRALGGRVDQEGVLHVVSQIHRSQIANRREAVERFRDLLAGALRPRKRRVATRIPRAAKRQRLQSKRLRGEKKRLRKEPPGEG